MLEYTSSELMLSTSSESWMGLGLNRDSSRACMVADTLAWAVSHDIPIAEALKSLPFYRELPLSGQKWRDRFAAMRDFFIPFRPLFWLVNIKWSWNLKLMIQDMEKGDPLSSALERNLRHYFPGFYLMGIAKAEGDGCLDVTLPVLARQLNFPSTVASERKMEIFFAGSRILITMNVLLFVIVKILPIFEEIFNDFLGATMSSNIMLSMALVTSFILKTSIFVIITVFILSKIECIGDYVIIHIPFIGRERKCFILSDLARSMAVFIRQGEDILSAAEWSMQSTRSQWLKKRLDGFIMSLRNGENWIEAWSNMKLGGPLDEWIIRNAAIRQDPASGFELLAEWLHQEIEFTTKRLERWIDPFCTLTLAIVVGSIAYQLFSMLTSIIYKLSEM